MTTEGTDLEPPHEQADRLLVLSQRMGRLWSWHIDRASGTWAAMRRVDFGPETGVTSGPLPYRNALDLFGDPHSRRLAEQIEDLFARGTLISEELVTDTRAGPLHFQIDIEPERDGSGAIVGAIGVTQDITERVEAERRMARDQDRLRALFDALDKAGIGIGVQDNRGRIMSASPSLLEIAGQSSEDAIRGRRWSDMQGIGGLDIRAEYGAVIEEAVAGRTDRISNMEIDWVRPDGKAVSALVRLAPLPDGDRAMLVLDQSEQKRAREEARARDSRTRAILEAVDSAGIGYAVIDHEDRIFDVSRTLRAIMHLDPGQDVLGNHWTDLFHLAPETQRLLNQTPVATEGSQVYPEFLMPLPDGAVAQIHLRSTPLPGIGRLLLVIDQTYQWRLERRQAEMERHMQKVQKMEALGQLAGGVAHEINNMLHPIRTFARAAGRTDDVDRRSQLHARIIDCTDKAAAIVRETLSFARGADTTRVNRSLNKALSGVVTFSRDLQMSGIELEIGLPDQDLRAEVNETEFMQIMLNLIQNAQDAMGDQGLISIELAAHTVRPDDATALSPGNFAAIRVSDNGPGMTPEVADRIFEPFFTTKEPGKGTGLGLSVAYGILQRWQGELRLETAPGEGTTIEMLLPLVEPDPQGVK